MKQGEEAITRISLQRPPNPQNLSSDTVSDLFFEVATLSGGNVLCNADGGPGGAGSTVTVPPADLGADGELAPGESFVVAYDIGLTSFQQFTFFVDAFGVVQ